MSQAKQKINIKFILKNLRQTIISGDNIFFTGRFFFSLIVVVVCRFLYVFEK